MVASLVRYFVYQVTSSLRHFVTSFTQSLRLRSHFVYAVTSFTQSLRLYSHFVYTVTSFTQSLRLSRFENLDICKNKPLRGSSIVKHDKFLICLNRTG